jgi:arabinogalactan oligomer/maltooligosaccharide transport system permease protein
VDNGNGNFVNPDNPEEILYPGWRAFNPAQNYLGLITDPRLSGPFLGVFVWTVVFSLLTVAMMFGVGFLLAVVLDKPMRGRNFYRAILILPYAMPSFMSILIWAGMFNREIGVFNAILGTEIDWLNDPWLARGALLLVNLWLGFPYFYLIGTGALQALPSDMEEAASIDGASAAQIFWRIKLPLVLEILAPLLIASLAFNFNNFNLVFLLTRGGPTNVIEGESAGATDILITYAYKTAFTGAQQDFGLASAISVIVFVIVGALSLWSLKQSKALEENK